MHSSLRAAVYLVTKLINAEMVRVADKVVSAWTRLSNQLRGLKPGAAPSEALSKTKQVDFDRQLKAHKQALDLAFTERVRVETERYLGEIVTPLRKSKAQADSVTEHRKGVFTQAEFNKLFRPTS